MDTKDWITIAAIVLGPLLAVQATQWLDRRRAKRDRRLAMFTTLMWTRRLPLDLRHVQALNMIDVEFHGGDPRDRVVVAAWKDYLDHLNNKVLSGAAWVDKTDDLMAALLEAMGQSLGFGFDRSHIRTVRYAPQAYADVEIRATAGTACSDPRAHREDAVVNSRRKSVTP